MKLNDPLTPAPTVVEEATQKLQAILAAQRQNQRLLKLNFPRQDGPAGVLMLANRLDAVEGISRDFQFNVEVLSDSPDIPLKDVLGKLMTVSLQRDDGSSRHFNGYVFDFRFVRNDAGFSVYDAVLLPWLAFLRYRRDNYLFHGSTVLEQTEAIFGDYECRDWDVRGLDGDVTMTDACQFDESDYNYLHRRWEAQGWHYWYEHSESGHQLILSADSTQAEAIDGQPQIEWQGKSGVTANGLWSFSPIRTVASTNYAAAAFDFKRPKPVVENTPTLNNQGAIPELEIYEYAGAYGFAPGAGKGFAQLRMEEIEAAAKHFQGSGDIDSLQPRRSFTLVGHLGAALFGQEEGDNDYLILDVRHSASNNYETRHGQGSDYSASFSAIRKKIAYRPGRGFNSVEPRIYGLQTAIVVGPAGQEIHTDEYGRVRVQFHWDREGSYDEKSSAWVRVASTWAGSNFGFMAIPRIGQEVLVQYLDGNPDRPLITGRVYNQDNMPPWELPANKTQTGILTRSSQGGGYDNANAIRFEDKKGEEQLWLHAEKDQLTEVEHDEDKWVGNDRRKTIDRDETNHIKRDRTETVDRNEKITVHGWRTEEVDGDETITIHSNRTERVDHNETISIGDNRTEDVGKNETISIGDNRTETVGKNETVSIGQNQSVTIGDNRSVTIGGNKTETVQQAKAETIALAKALTVGLGYQVSVGGAMNTTVGLMQSEQVGVSKSTNVGTSYTISAGEVIELRCGQSVLRMDSAGKVTITGTEFLFDSSGPVQINGKDIDLN
jgi:type VI secretion system secreted protein VgrG